MDEPGDAGTGPGKSFLFFLTRTRPLKQIGWRGGVGCGRARGLLVSGSCVPVRENPGERVVCAVGRTDNRSRSSR